MTPVRNTLLALCAVLVVGACSGTPAPTTPTNSSGASPTAGTAAADETAAVRTAFEDYKKAALAKDGAATVNLLSAGMHRFYDESRVLALTGGADKVGALPPSSAFVVYALRAEFDAATLRAASPADLVKSAVEKNLVGENARSAELGEITVNGDAATALMVMQGKQTDIELPFAKEGGRWRMDPRPLLAHADDALRDAAKQRGVAVEEMLDGVLAQRYGAERVPALKKPLEG
ncbi:hypothetical protein FHS29_003715 [Saccharothrix tamanrassetensis]|uniref:Lipoprotein n=1 Tax=Saccharothrix tamanrassetensis TaxID=1051531 RepID=A0A841CEZ2_9PSEU|nr:hypothetical protein [Saccharothrix tamanrassetensis]MBB5957122.1 hypothetical protein [Saccharothrix tamanrassetensis]